MYFMSLMALSSTPKNVNRERSIQIAIVHDLAECIVGDITPQKFSGVTKEEKHKMELEAITKITQVTILNL